MIEKSHLDAKEGWRSVHSNVALPGVTYSLLLRHAASVPTSVMHLFRGALYIFASNYPVVCKCMLDSIRVGCVRFQRSMQCF